MGISISGSNSISGLGGSDTNFDKVLSQLKQIESIQLNRLEAWKSDWNLRYEAFSQIIDQVQAASNMLSQLGDKNNFVQKLVQSSNDNVITAVANASAQDVQHTIKVNQTASNAIWANAHVYATKNDIINTSGGDAYFNYSYAGKEHSFKVPANTTLESFASMFNNSADNPGVKVSIIQAGNGYVFQVSGKDTGADNDLIIHDSDLVGMRASGSTSTWLTNNILDPSESVIDPNTYIFDLVLLDGSKKSVTVKGNASADELVAQLNNAAGGINASVDSNGNLTIKGVQSFSRRMEGEDPYTPPATRFTILGELKDGNGDYVKLNAVGGLADGLGDNDEITFTMDMEDGSTREIKIKAGATKRDLLVALAQGTQAGSDVKIDPAGDGWTVNLSGVTGISVSAGTDPTRFRTEDIPAKGVKNTLGGSISNATLSLTFDSAKLGDRIDGKASADPQDLTFTFIKDDGSAFNIYGLTSDMTNQDLLDAIQNELTNQGISYSLNGDKLEIQGAKEFRVSQGGIQNPAWTSSLNVTTYVPASTGDPDNSLFYQDPTSGQFLLEEAPELVYEFTTNSGVKGTLTLPSGSTRQDILQAMQNPNSAAWSWVDKDGNSTGVPSDWDVKFIDADGNEVTTLGSQPVYLQLGNVQSVKGPDMAGQVATSSNWSIQRAANARFQVDNWPVEMESSTNSISDVIEGVVFNLQEVGEARISVSTDIASIEESIQNFLDAVNSVLLTVNELMKFDEAKDVTSNDPNDIGSDKYSPSGLTNQKGGLLMGNYGVQLFKSRFSNLLTTTPPGFQSRTSATDVLSGDVLASLANLGIKTDTDATSQTYGLLVIAPSSAIGELQSLDKENYKNMINNNLEAVVDFFCSTGTGSSTSTDFRYGSHVEGITTAGIYEVKYTVNPDGTISNVTIGGEPAKQDFSQPGNYFSVSTGDPRGLSILIDDLTVGDHPPAGAEPQYIRIKQGLVQTTNNWLKAELTFHDVNISAGDTQDQINDAIALKSKNGALMSLRDNYMTVMESIDVKIEREQRRIDTWYSRQKTIFANLETLLKQYEQQQTSLEAQLKQLGNSSK